ncbi:isoprenyl transferase [Occultella aeris]|uniref:Isoprenyl transferase n=1 Tax=Occultella aeris TaxID=2761496 RepID=A0A7M4DIX7_9MICO|nr:MULTISPECIES: isoprenyl transferase [Occultella]VZO36944.1 (2Z,6E)-farnesyl diphosphate synthase [Occultella aeris]
MRPPNFLYGIYERKLANQLHGRPVPHHIGVMLDGNRRWARSVGLETAQGHQAGADRITDLLTWCEEVGVGVVTLWMLSTDNLRRDPAEITDLLEIIAATVAKLATTRRWRLRMVGELDLLPEEISDRLRAAEALTADVDGVHVNIAVGYGGRHEIANAVRSLIKEYTEQGRSLEDLTDAVTVDKIAEHLYTKGQPDPDLVIRTSGEQRLGGFLLWQSAHSEFYFCEAYWPDFRRVDFLRALRSFGERERRLGR